MIIINVKKDEKEIIEFGSDISYISINFYKIDKILSGSSEFTENFIKSAKFIVNYMNFDRSRIIYFLNLVDRDLKKENHCQSGGTLNLRSFFFGRIHVLLNRKKVILIKILLI